MTAPRPTASKPDERIDINFPAAKAQDWSTLAYLAFKKKYSKIGQVIEEVFGVYFEAPTSANPITNPIRSVAFHGDPALQAKIETVLNVLLEDTTRPATERRYLNRAAVTEIALEVKETGTYVPKVLVPAAINSSKPSSTAKREPTQAQLDAEEKVRNNDLSFLTGPAGTGKTFVAMKVGIGMLIAKAIKKLLLARPATEAGEKIGFLPGTQEDKLAPYMRPLYDELDKAFGRSKWTNMMTNGDIEIVPVGFMRGRTFDDAFIVIDEAQNMTEEQLDMAATRIGYNSKMVITGDPNQIDLKPKSLSALVSFMDIMRDEPSVGVQEFEGKDCVRSRIAQTIVNAIANKRTPKVEERLEAKPVAAEAKETSAPKVRKQSKLVQAFTETTPAKAKNPAATTKDLKAALDKVAAPSTKKTTGTKATQTAQSALEKAIPAPTAKGTIPAFLKPKKKA